MDLKTHKSYTTFLFLEDWASACVFAPTKAVQFHTNWKDLRTAFVSSEKWAPFDGWPSEQRQLPQKYTGSVGPQLLPSKNHYLCAQGKTRRSGATDLMELSKIQSNRMDVYNPRVRPLIRSKDEYFCPEDRLSGVSIWENWLLTFSITGGT